MRRFLSILLMVLTVGCTQGRAATADGDSVATPRQELRHAVRYQYETRLYRHGDDLYLVTLSLEWPQRLNASTMPALQRFLTGYLLGKESAGMMAGLRDYFALMGEQLTMMPDDEGGLRRHYVELHTQLFWYEANRYVSLYAFRQERDGEGHLLETKHRFLTYDLLNDRILKESDVFNANKMWSDQEGVYRIPFEEEIVKHAVFGSESDYVDMSTLPQDIALMGDAVLFDLGGAPPHANYNNLSFIKTDDLSYILSRQFKKYLKTPAPDVHEAKDYAENVSEALSGQPLVFPDSIPEFPGGKAKMSQFMADNLKYPDFELSAHIEGKVVVSLVVNADGSLSDFLVLNPVSPGLAREAVRVFTEMPRWKAGMLDGQPVCSRISVPVTFKYKE